MTDPWPLLAQLYSRLGFTDDLKILLTFLSVTNMEFDDLTMTMTNLLAKLVCSLVRVL